MATPCKERPARRAARTRPIAAALAACLLAGACSPWPRSPETERFDAARVAGSRDASATRVALDSIFRAAFPDGEPGGAAIVVRAGEVLYRGAAGLADVELGTTMRPEMVFQVASVTKQFTGVGILMLAEEGRLALSDPLTRHLPDYPVGDRHVTIEHLLAHTSGIRSYTSMPEWLATVRNDVTLDELISVFRDQPFDFEPGERMQYNNSGYVLLGAIIERVSGMDYAEFIRTRILEPVGMEASSFSLARAIVPNRARGYSRWPDRWSNADLSSLTHAHAAGALLSTVDDLARWDAAIARGDLLSPAGWSRAFTPFTLNDGRSAGYGAGWMIGRLGRRASIEHGGDMPGFAARAIRVPEAQLYVAVLANANPSPRNLNAVMFDLAEHALGEPLEAPAVALDPARLDDYAGRYRHGENDIRTVRREGDRLYSQRGTGPTFELRPVGEDLFELAGTRGTLLRFIREAGQVVAVELDPRVGVPSRALRVRLRVLRAAPQPGS